MVPYAIGLDIGVASVGWAVVVLDDRDHPCGIYDMGVRTFPAAEHPKTGASLAVPRREARSARRRLRRHRHRNERIRSLLVSSALLSQDALAHLFEGRLEVRVRALDEAVTPAEFARILIHLSQRRGFRSNRKKAADNAVNEEKKLSSAIKENRQHMQEHGYRTAAEMFLRDESFAAHKRNKGGAYLATIQRDMVEEEARAIFAAQRSLGADFAGETLENDYLEILLSQRSFDQGPGSPSPYGGDQIEKMIGKCTLIKEQPRAAKATYSFEYFSFLEKLSHLRIQSASGGMPLTAQQRQCITELALNKASATYLDIRKLLALDASQTFNMVRCTGDDPQEAEKKTKLGHFKAYHQMRKAFEKAQKGRFATFSIAQRDAIATAVSLYKTPARIREALADQGFTEADLAVIENLSFSKFGHLSIEACQKLIPFLEEGMNYSDACAAAGENFKGHSDREKGHFIRVDEKTYENITSPVVRRSMSQAIKVVNAIIRRMGDDNSPVFINIELARETAKTPNERSKAVREMLENQKKNEQIMERLRTEHHIIHPTGQDLVKLRLWEEQDGKCAYSLRSIPIERLFDAGYAEVDHIVPYSVSFDDSQKNKVLVRAEENRQKGNRLPLQYLTDERHEAFRAWVKLHVHNPQKRRQLLRESLSKDDLHQMRERSLTDTRTASVYLANILRDHLLFSDGATGIKEHVRPVNGVMTAYMRKRLGIKKNRADGDLHHAVDALVIACTTPAMINEISQYAQQRECVYIQDDERSYAVDPKTGESYRSFPLPWHHFRKELEARLAKDPAAMLAQLKLPLYMTGQIPMPKGAIFVSRMPNHKVTGEAHEATRKRLRTVDGKTKAVVKTPLTKLNLKNGQIEDYYDKDSDPLLYDALLARLLAFDGKAEKAFAEEFHKPKSDGTPGPIVRSVKIAKAFTDGVSLERDDVVAKNENMVRVDIFFVPNDGYYFVPIYVTQTLDQELPNRACVQKKEWKAMQEEDFLFSLYPGDLIRITHKDGLTLKKIFAASTLPDETEKNCYPMYLVSAKSSDATFKCINHDNTYQILSLGIKTLDCLEKMTVDVLGNVSCVSREKRMPFVFKKR